MAELSFNSANWQTVQGYTIAAIDDLIEDGNTIVPLSVVITADPQSVYDGFTVPGVNVVTLDALTPITIYNAGIFDGNLGGRVGADTTCATAASQIQACVGKSKVHAFFSSTSDDMNDMPTAYGYSAVVPIQGPTGLQLSINWTELFNSPGGLQAPYLDMSLAAAEVLPADQRWWSGSFVSGMTAPGFQCNNWTSNAATDVSYVGFSSFTDVRWLWHGVWINPTSFDPEQNYACSNTAYLLCACGN